jgi:predicted secreted protein
MTSGIVNGTLIGVYVDGTLVARAVSGDLDLTMATRDTSNKDTGGWEESLEGRMSWSCSAEGMMVQNLSGNFSTLFAKLTARASVTVLVSPPVGAGTVGDKKWSGAAFITNLKLTAADQSNTTFSCSFKGTGALTEATL